jgi:hypothetical protein
LCRIRSLPSTGTLPCPHNNNTSGNLLPSRRRRRRWAPRSRARPSFPGRPMAPVPRVCSMRVTSAGVAASKYAPRGLNRCRGISGVARIVPVWPSTSYCLSPGDSLAQLRLPMRCLAPPGVWKICQQRRVSGKASAEWMGNTITIGHFPEVGGVLCKEPPIALDCRGRGVLRSIATAKALA